MAFTRLWDYFVSFRKWFRNSRTCVKVRDPQISNTRRSWGLAPLTPEYRESDHAPYVEAINAALDDPEVLNIALSGNYGVGKSSILKQLAKLRSKNVVELSMSTLAPIGNLQSEGGLPEQATTSTNRIQQEIVKQLLYREDPKETPGSRFRRIEAFNWAYEAGVAFIAGVLISVTFLLSGWTEKISLEIASLADVGSFVHAVILVLGAMVFLFARRIFHGRVHIRQLSAGSAVVKLDDKSVSYFDQYLDEIVYFFQKSGRNIVIFEDIDRFNEARIFEALRSLNTLLNASPQTNKPIRFIYATKDSIFDVCEGDFIYNSIDDTAQSEAVRANRTKFFDLVIPVVPFITHQNARNLAAQLLTSISHEIKPELVDLASKHIPDMRLLKNVVNEFIVFRERIFSGDGEKLRLKETDLFALMLYKSTHITDFEAIHIGKSDLDTLYEVQRNLVNVNIKQIELEKVATRKAIANHNTLNNRSNQLGEKLLEHLSGITSAFEDRNRANLVFKYYLDRSEKSEDELRSVEFWREFTAASGDPELRVGIHPINPPSFAFRRSKIAHILNDSLNVEDWWDVDLEELQTQLTTHQENLRFLRSADMGDLIKRPEFNIEYNSEEMGFSEIAQKLLGSDLAYSLIREGYINRNFTLYSSIFHKTRVSTAAMNFLIHNLDVDVMDEHFELNGNDVEAIIRERGLEILSYSSSYNINILDELLKNNKVVAADRMIRSLASFGEDQLRFLQAYLNGGLESEKFVERFTRLSMRALVYLIGEADIDENSRFDFVDVSLSNLRPRYNYQIEPKVKEYLECNYSEFSILTDAKSPSHDYEVVADLFQRAKIRLPELDPLNEVAQKSFVDKDLYLINRDNIEVALDGDSDLSLDNIRSLNEVVYKYILNNLELYLLALPEEAPTIGSELGFIDVLENIKEVKGSFLDEIISRSSDVCIVNDIEQISEGFWPFLAKYKRFPATYRNVQLYIGSMGSIDVDVGQLLISAGKITECEVGDDEERANLGKTVLLASKNIPSVTIRVDLVASLQLRYHLDLDDLPSENGTLYGLLLQRDIIDDCSEAYAFLAAKSWHTREYFISQSTEFINYITPDLVRADLVPLLRSDKVNSEIKKKVLQQASDYFEDCGADDLQQLAKSAVQHGIQLPMEVVHKLPEAGASSRDIVFLLKPHLETLSYEELFQVLELLDGDYPALTSIGRKGLKIPNTPEDIAIVGKLQRHGIVTTFDVSGTIIKVNRRRKP